jgi:hypothetical protein
MTDDEDAISGINSLDADDRALAIHEAGHAVAARALGTNVVFVEINFRTGAGKTGCSEEIADKVKNLAVSVAGRKAEHAFAALALRSTRIEERSRHDLKQMENLLLRFPEAERCAARGKLQAGDREPDSKCGCCAQDRGRTAGAGAHRRRGVGCAARSRQQRLSSGL